MVGIKFPTEDLEKLRVAVGEWSTRNFSHTLPAGRSDIGMVRCASGMSEELSELVQSCTPLVDDGLLSDPNVIAFEDAIGDMCIYSVDLLYKAGISIQEVLVSTAMSRWERSHMRLLTCSKRRLNGYVLDLALGALIEGLTYHVGQVSRACLKLSQRVRQDEDHHKALIFSMCNVWRLCHLLCEYTGADLWVVVSGTASSVLKRDWVADPEHGQES